MAVKIFFTILLIFSLIIESTLIAFPLVFVLSLFILALYKNSWMLAVVFLFAFAVDAIRVAPLGLTPAILMGCAILFSFYQRTLHAADIVIFSVIIFALSIIYDVVAGYPISIGWSMVVFGFLWLVLYSVYKEKGIISEREVR